MLPNGRVLDFKCSGPAYEKLFNRLPNHVITVSHKRKVPEVSVEQCARRCIFEMNFRCKGYDFEAQHRNCWLTDLTVESGGGVKYHKGADFYELIIGEYLDYFYPTPYKIVLGRNDKTSHHVSPDRCARNCLEEKDFVCRSFDYQVG
nr:hypothetical protein BaRGS_020761 [Batillaria attramentaria]